jgi:hypothetical protein
MVDLLVHANILYTNPRIVVVVFAIRKAWNRGCIRAETVSRIANVVGAVIAVVAAPRRAVARLDAFARLAPAIDALVTTGRARDFVTNGTGASHGIQAWVARLSAAVDAVDRKREQHDHGQSCHLEGRCSSHGFPFRWLLSPQKAAWSKKTTNQRRDPYVITCGASILAATGDFVPDDLAPKSQAVY